MFGRNAGAEVRCAICQILLRRPSAHNPEDHHYDAPAEDEPWKLQISPEAYLDRFRSNPTRDFGRHRAPSRKEELTNTTDPPGIAAYRVAPWRESGLDPP